MAAIADMSDLIFKGTVDEIDVGKIAVGLPCRIKVGALPDEIVTGRLSRIAPQAQKSEGATLFDVEIELDPEQAVVLRAGYSANADVVTNIELEALAKAAGDGPIKRPSDGKEVKSVPDCIGDEVRGMAEALQPGQVLLLAPEVPTLTSLPPGSARY